MTLRTRLLPLLLVPLTLAGAAACATTDQLATGAPAVTESAPATAPAIAPADPAVEATTSIAARVTKPTKAYAEPTPSAKVLASLGSTTPLGSKTTLLVVDTNEDWVRVALPVRPNGTTGWIRAGDVELKANTKAITVDRAGHRLVLSDGGRTLLETSVAVGSQENPTPAGSFFVTDLLDTEQGNGAYGPYAFGLSGHSETLSEFGGGDGQLGIHGTNEPASIGRSVSHGCVRVPNDVVRTLVGLVPLGTPVTIV